MEKSAPPALRELRRKDGASKISQTVAQVKVPEAIHLLWMPPKSPELQPAERLWPLADEPLANRTFRDLDELEEVVCQRCEALLKRPEWIRGCTQYHWWQARSQLNYGQLTGFDMRTSAEAAQHIANKL